MNLNELARSADTAIPAQSSDWRWFLVRAASMSAARFLQKLVIAIGGFVAGEFGIEGPVAPSDSTQGERLDLAAPLLDGEAKRRQPDLHWWSVLVRGEGWIHDDRIHWVPTDLSIDKGARPFDVDLESVSISKAFGIKGLRIETSDSVVWFRLGRAGLTHPAS